MTRSTTWAKPLKTIARWLGVAAFWLLVWQLISTIVAQELLVPAPFAVGQALWELMGRADFWASTGLSLLRIMAGWLLGTLAGALLAVVTTRFAAAQALLSPLLRIVRAAPVASFIILALVWIHTNTLPAFISFLMVTPLVWGNVSEGIRQTDPQLLEMAKVYRWRAGKIWRHIRIPSVAPYFLASLSSGLGFAWKSGVAAEVICQPAFSIGRELYRSKLYLETPQVFAWTITAVALSLLLEKGVLWAIGRLDRRGAAARRNKHGDRL